MLVLASHTNAQKCYTVCLAMELAEDGALDKALTLIREFTHSFRLVTHTLHPCHLQGEARGKSSCLLFNQGNVAFAAAHLARIDPDHSAAILTVLDADTCFAQDYFDAISWHFYSATPHERKRLMFVPPSVFDRFSKV